MKYSFLKEYYVKRTMNARIKQSLSLLFLAFFLTTKMAGLHVLTHDDSDLKEDCAICHVLVTDHQTAVVLQEAEEFVPVASYPVFQEKQHVNPTVSYKGSLHSYHLFSRPPPAA